MAARIRNESWIEDEELKEVMKKYVSQGLRREEMMDYLERDFSQYAWSFRTLDRSLRAFGIYYTDKRVSLEEVQELMQFGRNWMDLASYWGVGLCKTDNDRSMIFLS